ncbi:MAG: 3-isopropylmalate dehydrogenase [Firmicutes bacterium]|nr:3-isopropylmalate dehydrogenase [Bacillota bacterium]
MTANGPAGSTASANPVASRRRFPIVVLPGDGVGPEVTAEAVRVLGACGERFGFELDISEYPVGGAAIRQFNNPLPAEVLQAAQRSSAILFGAVGDPAFDSNPPDLRPEKAILGLRKGLGLFANLRPVKSFNALAASSPLRADIAAGIDMLVVRELTGGLYFGPKSREAIPGVPGGEKAVDTLVYTTAEIERITRVAFDAARLRRRNVSSVDKANVLESSRMWRSVVNRVAAEYPDVAVDHQYVDSCAMKMVAAPGSYDVILTENTFGDILSDLGGALVGSLGLLPSASMGSAGPALYEPVHGSAPDIAGKGIANPVGAIMSAAMMLRYSLNSPEAADVVERAVESTLDRGWRTRDMGAGTGVTVAGTSEMGTLIADAIRR